MNKGCLILFTVFFCAFHGYALENKLTVSVLTLDPGKPVYSVFGHTAIRIVNVAEGTDRVYNFGTFDFNDPLFYFKFVRGNLRYFLSVTDFNSFLSGAIAENRTLYEQVLHLSDPEKRKLASNLELCFLSPDRYYVYDFFFNNCATKVRDFMPGDLLKACQNKDSIRSFRQLLEPYLLNRYWLNIGINLALGRQADRIAQPGEQLFLPDFIKSTVNCAQIVPGESVLFAGNYKGRKRIPDLVPWTFSLLLIGFSFFHATSRPVTTFILSAFGLAGIILLVTSFISHHPAFQHNFNIWWTAPAIFVLFVPKGKTSNVITVLYIVFLFVILIFRNHMPQAIASILLPWIVTLTGVLLANTPAVKNFISF